MPYLELKALFSEISELLQQRETEARQTFKAYRNPETGDTWSGRGKAPAWMQALLDQGRQLEEFAIGTEATLRRRATVQVTPDLGRLQRRPFSF
jgi:hypothetical protein